MSNFLLSDLLERARDLWPDRVAIRDAYRAVTYRELAGRAAALGNLLRDGIGVPAGGRFGLLTGNRVEIGEMYYGAAYAGCVCVPMNPRLTTREAASIAADAEAVVVFTDEERADSLAAAGLRVIRMDQAYERLLASASARPRSVSRDDQAIVLQLYTSGTTGHPKGAMLSHRNQLAIAWSHTVEQTVVPDDAYLVTTPMCHVTGASRIFSCALVGATIESRSQFDPDEVLALVRDEAVTATVLVPTMLRALVDAAVGGADPPQLRRIAYGTAPISPQLLREAREVFQCEFQQGYGLTETSGHASVLPPADHLDTTAARFGSAGRPAAGVRLRVVGDDGTTLATDEVGEVLIRAGNVMEGYWNRETDTAKALRDGWLHTGDVGRMDGDGYLHLVDRRSDMLVSGGFNVYPKEIELQLEEHPAVGEVAVVGIPDERWGETPVAFVVATADGAAGADELEAWCRDRLAGFKIPRRWQIVEQLPRTTFGKVDKRALRTRLERTD